MGFLNSIIELISRVFLSTIFFISGLNKILNYEGAIEYMETYNMLSILLIPAIIIEIILPLFLILGYKTKLSAIILAIFTVLVAIIFHSDFSNQVQMISFLKNISIAGGLFILAINGPGTLSLDKKLN